MKKPNFLVILIDDLRYDEVGAGDHPYMKTPNIDRLAAEGAMFERAFHTTPICSPNRASILTGQYASRHGIIDNVARDAASHRLPNYHLALQHLGYETAHIGKWHMGNAVSRVRVMTSGSRTTATGGFTIRCSIEQGSIHQAQGLRHGHQNPSRKVPEQFHFH